MQHFNSLFIGLLGQLGLHAYVFDEMQLRCVGSSNSIICACVKRLVSVSRMLLACTHLGQSKLRKRVLSRMNNYSTAYGINDYGECCIEVSGPSLNCFMILRLLLLDGFICS